MSQSYTRWDVLKYFLETEILKSTSSELSDLLSNWDPSNEQQLTDAVRAYIATRNDTNPCLIWTVGIRNDRRFELVDHWKLEEVNLASLYIPAMTDKVKDLLEKSQYNLKVLHTNHVEDPAFKNEFLNLDLPHENLRTLILLRHSSIKYKGDYELVDGAHRTIAMIHNKQTTANAFVAILRDNPTTS